MFFGLRVGASSRGPRNGGGHLACIDPQKASLLRTGTPFPLENEFLRKIYKFFKIGHILGRQKGICALIP